MRNIIIKSIIPFVALPLLFAACSEVELITYDQSPRVVFVQDGSDINPSYKKTFDFTYVFTAASTSDAYVRIQGLAMERDQEVFFKIEPVEDFDMPEIELIDQSVTIPAGEYTARLRFKVKRPGANVKVFKCYLAIDYEKSGLEKGIVERSKFEISAHDNFIYEWGADKYLKITLQDYNTFIAPSMGPVSMMKVRFMIEHPYLKGTYPSLENYRLYGQIGLGFMMQGAARSVLDGYNADHPDEPLTDENGNLVTFP